LKGHAYELGLDYFSTQFPQDFSHSKSLVELYQLAYSTAMLPSTKHLHQAVHIYSRELIVEA